MKEVFRTNDVVKLSYIEHLLQEAGIKYFIADQHISAVEGNIGAFPRRVMVPEESLRAAETVLSEVERG
jgi:Putative prokaryotic signal transducing protein